MELQQILSFLVAAVLLTLMPGPDNLYVITESLSKGAKQGILISVGLVSGVLVHTALAAFGVSLIFTQSNWAYNLMSVAGASYLFYLAYMSYQEKPQTVEFTEEKPTKIKVLPLVKKGFFMNVLNPKVSLFFIALLPQFVSENGWPIQYQMLALGVIFIVQGLLLFSCFSLLAGYFSELIQHPKFWLVTKWLKVIILSTIAFGLLLSIRL